MAMTKSVGKSKLRIYLNEYNIQLEKTAYLPLATALLQAYAQSKQPISDNYEFMPAFYKLDLPENIIPVYQNPDIAAFSVSTWNEQLCLIVSKRIKVLFPKCLIIFGGPQVPFDAKEYFEKYDFIDVSVRGEGERPFADILLRFLETKDFSNIPGISYKNSDTGEYISNSAEQPPIESTNLDIFPSPYLAGVFDYLMKRDLQWQAIIETNRGCPFPCAYCFWGHGGLNRKYRYFSMDRIEKEIDWCGKHKIKYVFCADSNFGMLDRDKKIVEFLIKTKDKYNYPERFRVNYGKNTNDKIFNIAKELHKHELEKAITISFQSFNQEALANVDRKNIKLSTFQNLQRKYSEHHIPTYSELILGLPGETYDSWINGLEECLNAGINNNVIVYPCQVLPNTTMANPKYVRKYRISLVKIPLNEGHGAIRPSGFIREYENIVVGTYSMSVEDWKRSMVISWILQAFVGLKLALFVLIYLRERFQIRYIDFLRYSTDLNFSNNIEVIKKNILKLRGFADSITKGNSRTIIMRDFGGIYWEPEESFYLNISNQKEEFYDEMYEVIKEYLDSISANYDGEELKEIIEYQRALVPSYQSLKTREYYFERNVPEYFDNYFLESRHSLSKTPQIMSLNHVKDYGGDKKAFAQEIVVYGRKSDRMLYPVKWSNIDSKDTDEDNTHF